MLLLQRQHSDDDSDVLLRRATVLHDFTPEEEDEVAVSKGETVEVEYEVGGWIQVRKGLHWWVGGLLHQATPCVGRRVGWRRILCTV